MNSDASTSQAVSTKPVRGLSEVAGRYKALLLDQFGVLHDGRKPYPGAITAVSEAAHGRGMKLLIISNSSRRAGGTIDKLAAMGFDRTCFAGVVTSGEMAHRYLTTRPDAWWQGLGRRVLHINWSKRGPASLEGFGLEIVGDPSQADFILAHGTEALSLPSTSTACAPGGAGSSSAAGAVVVQDRSVEELKELLEGVAGQGRARPGGPPPMVVANPDLITVDGDDLVVMPGTLAAAYRAAGGPVVLMGKPAPLIYTACAELLGLPQGEILAVGDSVEHDIAGASAAGIDSLFIAGGIHARELLPGQGQGDEGQAVDAGALRQLCEHHGAVPSYVCTRFVW